MDGRLITEPEFAEVIAAKLYGLERRFDAVTGPGRSGAVAAVYASHILGIPFIPFKCDTTNTPSPLLIIDTARMTGQTLRKAGAWYKKWMPEADITTMALYEEPPRVRFWYEIRRRAGLPEYIKG